MIQKAIQILQKPTQQLFLQSFKRFSLNQHVYSRQSQYIVMIEQLKEPLFQRQQELRGVEQTIQEIKSFDKLKEYVNDYQNMVTKQKENIDDLMEYYVVIFLEKQMELEKKIEISQQSSTIRNDIINTLNDLILKYLNNFSKESLLIILNLITESTIDDKRKFFRIFEFAIARTQFVMKMKEDQVANLLQNIEKINKKGYLQKDVYIELIEKIEFAIVEQQMKEFEPVDLASIAYIYSTHYQGTESLFFLLQGNFNRVLKQMTLEQQVLTYWSLVNCGYFNQKPVLTEPKCKWINDRFNELKPYYQILFTNAYTQQKQFYKKSISNIVNSIIHKNE